MMDIDSVVVDWLLDGDPAIRWRTMQDLLDRAPGAVHRERARVATAGWGKRLLDEQDPEGTWANGSTYGPKWISTHYTLLLLRRLGLPPDNSAGRRACRALWSSVDVDGGITWPTSTVMPDVCVSAMFVTLDHYFDIRDPRRDEVVAWLREQQLVDGGWNCQATRRRVRHSSFHTTMTVLETLEQIDDREHDDAARRGREFFLEHRLYKSHHTGEIVHPSFTKFSFPPRWFYDVLRGLEYFASVKAPHDERLDDALDLLRSKQRKDGKWPVQNKHSGRVWFDMETGRRPSRWNTLRALRVLRWFD
jgi:hypothetical protein